MTIKIRGNTSAYSEKKPYKIKLQKRADLLKHIRNDKIDYSNKNWVLLKDATTLNTIVGLACSRMLMPTNLWIPEWEFVNVFINNQYRGCYMLIESIEQSDARINVSKDGFIIQKDTYWYTEDLYFDIDEPFNDKMKYTFKYPNNICGDDEKFNFIKKYISDTYSSLLSNDIEKIIDIDTFCSWILIHDVLGTSDYAGSNIFMSKNDCSEQTILKMETPWDFGSVFKQNNSWAKIHATPVFFYAVLFRNKKFTDFYVEKWDSVKELVWPELKAYLLQLQEIYEQSLDDSRKNDAELYGSSGRSMQSNIDQIQNWFETRSENLEEWISAELR